MNKKENNQKTKKIDWHEEFIFITDAISLGCLWLLKVFLILAIGVLIYVMIDIYSKPEITIDSVLTNIYNDESGAITRFIIAIIILIIVYKGVKFINTKLKTNYK